MDSAPTFSVDQLYTLSWVVIYISVPQCLSLMNRTSNMLLRMQIYEFPSWRSPDLLEGKTPIYVICFTGSIITALACRSDCAVGSFHSFKVLKKSFCSSPSSHPTICRSRGHPHVACNHPDLKTHFHPKGRCYLRKAKEERSSMQPAKSIHDQAETPRELCRPLKKGEPLGFSRKGNIRPKMAKKKPTALVNII